MTRVAVAALAGALIAWVVAELVLYAMFAAGGYTREALVEMSPGTFGLIGGSGASVGLAVVLLADRSPLPAWVRPAVVGSLAGAAAVVVLTLLVANVLGGPSSKGQAPYLLAGLVFGAPVGLAAGALAGLGGARRRRAEPGAVAGRPRE